MIGVTGVGVCLPEGRLSAAEIAARSGLPEWVVRGKLGLDQKPVPGPDDHPTRMGVWAAERVLERASVAPGAVDVVMNYGERLAEGTYREVIQNPQVIEAYLGDEAA